VGDLTHPASLSAAFAGVDGVFLLTAMGPTETQEGLAAVEAARQSRARRIVYMSVHRIEQGAHIPHFAAKIPIEQAVRSSGLAWTLIRPNNFYQVDDWFREPLTTFGVYPLPIGTVGLNRVDVRDIARAAVRSLLDPGHEGKTYTLAGPAALTGPAVAEIWSRHLGRTVRYGGDDLDAWAAQARRAMPEKLVRDLCIMWDFVQKGRLKATEGELEELRALLGREPRRFEDYAAETARNWRSGDAGPSVSS
jgi:uncharacterized protein YbjT (DUF2867 family)